MCTHSSPSKAIAVRLFPHCESRALVGAEDPLCNQKSGERVSPPCRYAQEQKGLAARRRWRRLDIVFFCLHGLNFLIGVLGVLDVGDGYAIDGAAQIKGTYRADDPYTEEGD